MKVLVTGLILAIIAFVVVFQIVGNTASDLTTAADSITDANNCSDFTNLDGEELVYNISDKYCYNGTSSGTKLYIAGQIDLPLNTLFGRAGVTLLILMAVILIVMVGIGLSSLKKK